MFVGTAGVAVLVAAGATVRTNGATGVCGSALTAAAETVETIGNVETMGTVGVIGALGSTDAALVDGDIVRDCGGSNGDLVQLEREWV